jgi:hypothetical protein
VPATVQTKDHPYTSVEHTAAPTCLVRLRHRREDIINMDLKEVAVKVLTGIGWRRMGSSGKFF